MPRKAYGGANLQPGHVVRPEPRRELLGHPHQTGQEPGAPAGAAVSRDCPVYGEYI